MYKYDPGKMSYVRATSFYLKVFIFILIASIIGFGVATYMQHRKLDKIKYVSEETRMLILNQENEFTPDKLKQFILSLNIKFPHIVYAQAKLESGNFKSKIFRENNNLFGMKVARMRPTTNKGEQNNHAYFNSWKDCVVDYAMYAAAYLNDIKTEQQYLDYLKANYAEDSKYYSKLIKMIKR